MDEVIQNPERVSCQKLSRPYKRKIGRTNFLISSFGNLMTDRTGQELIMEVICSEINENEMKQTA